MFCRVVLGACKGHVASRAEAQSEVMMIMWETVQVAEMTVLRATALMEMHVKMRREAASRALTWELIG